MSNTTNAPQIGNTDALPDRSADATPTPRRQMNRVLIVLGAPLAAVALIAMTGCSSPNPVCGNKPSL